MKLLTFVAIFTDVAPQLHVVDIIVAAICARLTLNLTCLFWTLCQMFPCNVFTVTVIVLLAPSYEIDQDRKKSQYLVGSCYSTLMAFLWARDIVSDCNQWKAQKTGKRDYTGKVKECNIMTASGSKSEKTKRKRTMRKGGGGWRAGGQGGKWMKLVSFINITFLIDRHRI